MKRIANNTKATDRVISKYNKNKTVILFPYDVDRGEIIDLIYIDNGCEEIFTLKSNIHNYNEAIILKDGEMILRNNTFLEQLEI